MSLNALNVGKLKFILSSLKGLTGSQLSEELDKLCADQDPISFYNCFFQAINVRRKNIFFTGPPGSGVGMCTKVVAPILMIPIFKSKLIIQKEMQQQTSFGVMAEKFVMKGELVPDEFVIPLYMDILKQPMYRSGLILDGFPRTIAQAEALEEIHPIDIVIEFSLPKEVLIKRLMGRRVCPRCNHSYNLTPIKEDDIDLPAILPKHEGLCDDCHAELVIRADDNPKIIDDRFDVFKERTTPVLEYYKTRSLLRQHSIKKGVSDLPDILKNILIQYLEKYNV